VPELARHAEEVPRSGIREVMDLAWSLPKEVIGLHVGEPSFPTPDHVIQAARDALARGETRYVPNAGIPALRDAIAAKLAERNGIAAEPAQVVVTAGGMQAIHLALSSVLQAGDEVLVPDPGWPNFTMAVRLLQATPVPYPLRAENGFQPDLHRLAELVGPRTSALIVNSPANPLGAVLTAPVAEGLCRLADEHDLWLLSDECYDAITFDVEHLSPAAWDRHGRVLTCFSFSKTYAMTGMRVGYLVAPPPAAATAAKLQETLIACVNVPAQHAALAALKGPQDLVETSRRSYQERRDAAAALLDAAGLGYFLPQGAFYIWIDVRDYCGGDVNAWALKLLRSDGVAVAPGVAFGHSGQGWVRASLAADLDELLDGLRRLSARRPVSTPPP
jgi:aspartate aminotransferase